MPVRALSHRIFSSRSRNVMGSSSPSKRKDAPPRRPGPLQKLAASRMSQRRASITPEHAPPPSDEAPPSDEDSDAETMRQISSQQSITDRIRAMPKDAKDGLGKLLPKRKPNSPIAGRGIGVTSSKSGAASPSSKRKKDTRNGHRNRNDQPDSNAVLAARSSDRLRNKKDKANYEYLAEPDDDDDFEDEATPGGKRKAPSRSRNRTKKKKRRARSPSPAPAPVTLPSPNSLGESPAGDRRLVLKLTSMKKRKTGAPTDKTLAKWEVARGQLDDEDRFLIGLPFREFYKAPPNNQRALARFRVKFGRDASEDEANEIFACSKPWGEKYYRFHERWTDLCREKKKNKPADKNPKLLKSELSIWFKEFVKENGIIQHTTLPKKYSSKKSLDEWNRREESGIPHPIDSEDEDAADFMDTKTKKNGNVDDKDEDYVERGKKKVKKNRNKAARAAFLNGERNVRGNVGVRKSPRKRSKTPRYRDTTSSQEIEMMEEEQNESANTKESLLSLSLRKKDEGEKKGRIRRNIMDENANGNAKRSRRNHREGEIEDDGKANIQMKIPYEIARKEGTPAQVLATDKALRDNPSSGEKDGGRKKGMATLAVAGEKPGEIRIGAKGAIANSDERRCDVKALIANTEERKDPTRDESNNNNMQVDEKVTAGPNQQERKKDGKGESKPFRIPRKPDLDKKDEVSKKDVGYLLNSKARWEHGRLVETEKEMPVAVAAVHSAYPKIDSGAPGVANAAMQDRRSISQFTASDSAC